MAISKVTSGGIADGTLSVEDIADDAVTAAKLANSINTDIATGVTGNTTANAALPKAGGAMTGTITGFTSTGIDDNATSTAITIDSSENVGIGTTAPAQKLDVQDSNYGVRISPLPGSKFVRIQLPTNEGNGLDTEKYIIAYNNAHSGHPHMVALKSNNSAGTIGFFTNNSESARIQSGGGISFNGDTAAANALNDYEEGQGSVVVKLGGTTLTVTGAGYKYVKIGNLVTFQFEFRITNLNGASSGSFEVALPFTTVTGAYGAGAIRIYQGAVDGDEFIGIDPNANQLYIARRVNNAGTANVTATNNAYYFGSLTYRT